MNTLTKEQAKAFQSWKKLKLLDLKHWRRYGFRKPSPYRLKIEIAETECFRLNLGTQMRSASLSD